MTESWHVFCADSDLVYDNHHIDVKFGDNRKHRVEVVEEADAYVLRAFVAKQATVSKLPDLPIQTWKRNRNVTLVGFRIDNRGRLVGEAWAPKIGITPDEFQIYVRTVATECDRFEYVLTGRDVE